MPDPLTVDERGANVAAKHLRDMGRRARDTRDSSYKVRTIFRKAEEKRFASQGAGTWAALKDSTSDKKRRLHQDPRVLRATNALYKSLTAPRATGQIDERTPDSMRYGTSVPYAAYHDQGKGVPKRRLIDLQPAERDEITKAIEDYIATGQADHF